MNNISRVRERAASVGVQGATDVAAIGWRVSWQVKSKGRLLAFLIGGEYEIN